MAKEFVPGQQFVAGAQDAGGAGAAGGWAGGEFNPQEGGAFDTGQVYGADGAGAYGGAEEQQRAEPAGHPPLVFAPADASLASSGPLGRAQRARSTRSEGTEPSSHRSFAAPPANTDAGLRTLLHDATCLSRGILSGASRMAAVM